MRWFKYNLLQYGDVIVHIVIFTFLTSVKYTLILEHVFIVKKLYFSLEGFSVCGFLGLII